MDLRDGSNYARTPNPRSGDAHATNSPRSRARSLWTVLGGCSDDTTTKPKGTEGGPCFDDKTCSSGLQCVSGTCSKATVDQRLNTEGTISRPDGTVSKPDGTVSKPDGTTCPGKVCNGACVDTVNDPKNCGDCGKTCQVQEACIKGKCEFGCVAGISDIQVFPNNMLAAQNEASRPRRMSHA